MSKKKVNKCSIKKKLIASYLFFATIPIIILGFFSVNLSSDGIYQEIKHKLHNQVEYYKDEITHNLEIAENETRVAESLSINIVNQVAQTFNASLDLIPNIEENRKNIINKLSKLKIGKTGYPAILEYSDRNVILYTHGKSNNKNYYDTKNSDGTYIFRDILQKGKHLRSGETADYTYNWKNKGEQKSRKKVASIIHIPSMNWLILFTAYMSDITPTELVDITINRFRKKLISQKVGKTGYMYVLNSKRQTVMHPKKGMIGKVVNADFVKEIVNKKNGVITYTYKGEEKIASFVYFPKQDWIIVAGSYLKDFTAPIDSVKKVITTILFLTIAIGAVAGLILANGISGPLMNIMCNLKSSSHEVSRASKEVSHASLSLSEASIQQASSIEETSASLEELSGIIENNVNFSKTSMGQSESVYKLANEGSVQISSLIKSMELILDSNKAVKESVEIIQKIAEKTAIIDDIVFQTKLLSFNASVEAERAGEHGRGFAVVAQEVGNLAKVSGKAALEISDIVKQSVNTFEKIGSENESRVSNGNEIVKGIVQTLSKIQNETESVMNNFKSVMETYQEEQQGIKQIYNAILQLDQAGQNNAASSEETASASTHLNDQASVLDNYASELNCCVTGKAA